MIPAGDSTFRVVLAIAALALVVIVTRAIYFRSLADGPFGDTLVVNARQYDVWARDGYPSDRPYYQAPLYIAYLDALYGDDTTAGRLATVRWSQALLTLGTAIAIFFLVLRRSENSIPTESASSARAGPRSELDPSSRARSFVSAGLASGLYVLAWPALFFDGELLPTTLGTFLLTVGLTLVLIRRDGRSGVVVPALAGLALGLAAIARPNFLVTIVAVLVVVTARRLRQCDRHEEGEATKRLERTAALALVLGLALPIAIVTIRNQSTGQGFVLITANGGDNLLLGAHPETADGSPFPPKVILDAQKKAESEGQLLVERDRASRDEAWGYWAADPVEQIRRTLGRGIAFFQAAPVSNNRSIPWQRERSAVLRWPPMGWVDTLLLLPLALYGFWRGRRQFLVIVSALVVVTLALSVAPFVAGTRFQVPALPWLCLLAGIGGVGLARDLRARRSSLAVALPLLVVGAIVAAAPGFRRESEYTEFVLNRARAWTETGSTTASENTHAEALATLEAGHRRFPNDPRFPAWIGELLVGERGTDLDPSEARAWLELATRLDPHEKRARRALAHLDRARGDFDAAIAHLQAALARETSDPKLFGEIGELFYQVGRYEDGLSAYHSAVSWSSSFADRARYEARIALGEGVQASLAGDTDTALAALERASRIDPRESTYPRVRGQVAAAAGRTADALVAFREALAISGPGALTPAQRAQVGEWIARWGATEGTRPRGNR